MIGKEVYAVSIDAASEQQRIAYGRVFELEERVFRNYGRTDVAGLCMNIYDISKTSMTAGLQFLSSILLCLIIIIASAVFLPVESALFILASLFIGIVMVVCRIRASGYNKTVAKARSRATDRLYQYIRNISKVKISGSEENILRDYYMMRSEMMPERIRASRLTNVSDVLRVLLLCGVLPITAAFVLKYIGISIIGLILCTAYFMLLMMQIVKMPLLAEDLGKAELLLSGAEEKTKGSIDTIDEIEIDLPHAHEAGEHDDHGTGGIAPAPEGAGQHVVDAVEEQEEDVAADEEHAVADHIAVRREEADGGGREDEEGHGDDQRDRGAEQQRDAGALVRPALLPGADVLAYEGGGGHGHALHGQL